MGTTARQLIEDSANSKHVSPAAYWELAIKIGIGKYVLHEPYASFVDRAVRQNGFLILAVEPHHTAALIAKLALALRLDLRSPSSPW